MRERLEAPTGSADASAAEPIRHLVVTMLEQVRHQYEQIERVARALPPSPAGVAGLASMLVPLVGVLESVAAALASYEGVLESCRPGGGLPPPVPPPGAVTLAPRIPGLQ